MDNNVKSDYFQDAINWANRKFNHLKANCEGYETPTPYQRQGDEEVFVPDISGRRRTAKYFVEIVASTENKKRMISKWRLLSTLAGMKGGKLYLLAPRGYKAFTQRILEKYALGNAELVYLG
jgi:hypothetical protein